MPQFREDNENQSTQERLNNNEGPMSKSIVERWKEVTQDDRTKEGMKSLGRLAANGLISAAEFVPVVGEIPDWIAKAAKFTKKSLDLTPDVSKTTTVALEGVDIATGGFLPSRAVELLIQARADYNKGNLKSGVDAIGYILTGKKDFGLDLERNQATLDNAAKIFEKA